MHHGCKRCAHVFTPGILLQCHATSSRCGVGHSLYTQTRTRVEGVSYIPTIFRLFCVTQEHQRTLLMSETALATWNCQPRFVGRIDSSRNRPAVRQLEIVRVETPSIAAISRGSSHVRPGSGSRSSICRTSLRSCWTSATSRATDMESGTGIGVTHNQRWGVFRAAARLFL